ncbi:unnamed protein product [Clavelina lepadiformis]|uniref:Uncharacterized protein n=2 Tax=Clavelina lepadiformis TaxID=159417 RepID=A0ABP0H0A0_CLALP
MTLNHRRTSNDKQFNFLCANTRSVLRNLDRTVAQLSQTKDHHSLARTQRQFCNLELRLKQINQAVANMNSYEPNLSIQEQVVSSYLTNAISEPIKKICIDQTIGDYNIHSKRKSKGCEKKLSTGQIDDMTRRLSRPSQPRPVHSANMKSLSQRPTKENQLRLIERLTTSHSKQAANNRRLQVAENERFGVVCSFAWSGCGRLKC